MTNDPARRPDEDLPPRQEGDEPASPGVRQPSQSEVWATVESQIDEIVRDEVDDPTDPSHPDYDLSTASPYRDVEPQPRFWFTSRWVLILVAFVAVTGLLLPYLQDIF